MTLLSVLIYTFAVVSLISFGVERYMLSVQDKRMLQGGQVYMEDFFLVAIINAFVQLLIPFMLLIIAIVYTFS